MAAGPALIDTPALPPGDAGVLHRRSALFDDDPDDPSRPALAAPPNGTPTRPAWGVDVEPVSLTAPLDIVINRGAAGGEDSALTQHLVHTLASSRRPLRWYPVDKPQRLPHLAEMAGAAAARDGGILVAVGGDGTINTLARQALRHDLPLAVVPRGTFNYFAREHRVPTEARGAVALLRHGIVRRVQVGRVGDEVFLVNASIGLYPDLLEQRERDTLRFGRSPLVAVLSGLRVALGRSRRLDLEIEHGGERRTLRAATLFVGNNAVQLEPLGLADDLGPRDGRLVALSLPPLGAAGMVRVIARAAVGRLGSTTGIEQFGLSELRVRLHGARRQRIKVALDGEVRRLFGPLSFRAEPAALRVVVPADA